MRVGNIRQYKTVEKKQQSEVYVKNMIESKIVKSLKHNKEANILQLHKQVQMELPEVEMAQLEKVLLGLEERDFIEREGNQVVYIP